MGARVDGSKGGEKTPVRSDGHRGSKSALSKRVVFTAGNSLMREGGWGSITLALQQEILATTAKLLYHGRRTNVLVFGPLAAFGRHHMVDGEWKGVESVSLLGDCGAAHRGPRVWRVLVCVQPSVGTLSYVG